MTRPLTAVLVAALTLIAPRALRAQTQAQPGAIGQPPPSIHVSADATISAAPDRAEIDFAVSSRASTSRRAGSDNAAAAKQVLDRVKAALGSSDTVATAGYSIQPEYRTPERGSEPQVAGYVATNTVRVTMAELARVGDVIDAAVAAGANNVNGVRFFLHDPDAVHSQALAQAARRARSQAEALAAALDLQIVRILSVTETSQAPRPMLYAAAAKGAAPQTPIESGTVDVQASVTLEVEVAPKR
jgi:uncharacterized protein YggE